MRVGLRASVLSLALLALLVGRSEADEGDKERAQAHYAEGLRAYNIGDFEVAIKEWTEGYRLHNAPEFLLNIAQAHRMTENYERALFFYTAYLRESPNAPNAEEVAALRDEMQRLVDERGSSTTETESQQAPSDESGGNEEARDPAEEADASVSMSTTEMPTEPSKLKVPGLIAAGAGVALIATGTVFAVLASGAESDLEAAARDGDMWSRGLENKESTGERNALLSKVFIGAGVVAVGTGAALYIIGWRHDSKGEGRESAYRLVPTSDGESLGFALGGSF